MLLSGIPNTGIMSLGSKATMTCGSIETIAVGTRMTDSRDTGCGTCDTQPDKHTLQIAMIESTSNSF